MEFTFGIITDGSNDELIKRIVHSVEIQNIDTYEIIVVGNSAIQAARTRVIPFDETVKQGWITRKKNIICQNATYENIVLLHDYVSLDKDWYKGFVEFGNNFQFCINPVKTNDGRRFRDYAIYNGSIPTLFQGCCLLPYDYEPRNIIRKLLYISGTYYVIKRDIARLYPLNEDLLHGRGEDVELSHRLSTNGIYIVCNPHSSVSLMKEKAQTEWENEVTDEHITLLDSLPDDVLEKIFENQRIQLREFIART